MTDVLLELRSEEIPARMQVKAKDDLARLFAEEIVKAGLVATDIETFATPRRLALIARGLPDATADKRIETKGPRVGAPEQALDGFLRRYGLTKEQLVERDGVYFAEQLAAGGPTWRVLQDAIPAIVRAFPWPKSMRWGAASASTESLRWVRPLQGVVAIFGTDVVPVEIDGIESGATTFGHRFHHSGPVTIESADSYVEQLRAAHVIVHLSERTTLIRDGAQRLAAEAGMTLVEDEGLVLENAGLTEWPVPLLGHFDPAFLDVPPEVIQLTARVNQKYFVLRDGNGRLAPNFVCTANIDATDGGRAIIAGNERVLSARLSDAKFFWENDLKVPLADQAAKLGQIVFHEKLGTVADKVERVAKLARWLCEEGIVGARAPAEAGAQSTGAADAPTGLPPSREHMASLAERAARLCKADLVTGMVGEFPELQGIIGGHLARAQGEPDAVADAIRDHYKPVGQGDDVPTDPVTVAVSLADKLDTIIGFFIAVEVPTGSKDPFALRRAAIGCLAILIRNDIRLRLHGLSSLWLKIASETGLSFRFSAGHSESNLIPDEALNPGGWPKKTENSPDGLYDHLLVLEVLLFNFFLDRLIVQQRSAGVRHDIIYAVGGGQNDPVEILKRVRALQGFVETPEGADLLAGYKRAANILKKETPSPSPLVGEVSRSDGGGPGASAPEPNLSARGEAASLSAAGAAGPHPGPPHKGEGGYALETAEAALIAALDTAEPLAAAAIDAEDFEAAMLALATLRTPIDAFFENVTVNDADPAKRTNRLALLARFRDAVHRVADFSKIEG